MGLLVNRAKCSTATTGTGTINIGSAVVPYQTWSSAGAISGNTYDYLLEDGANWELGSGVYTSGAPGTLTRPGPGTDPNFMSSSGSLISLSGSATVACVANNNTLFGNTPTVRSSTMTFPGNVSSFTANWPTGTAAGDTIILFVANGFAVTTPTGFTQLVTLSGTNNGGWVGCKVMTSSDISTGHVSVGLAGTFNSVCSMVCIQGGGSGVHYQNASRANNGSGLSVTGTGVQNPNDLLLYFVSNRGSSILTVDHGTSIQSGNDTVMWGQLNTQIAGKQPIPITLSTTFTVSGANGCFMTIVGVAGP